MYFWLFVRFFRKKMEKSVASLYRNAYFCQRKRHSRLLTMPETSKIIYLICRLKPHWGIIKLQNHIIMVLTTTPTIEGHPILEYKQIVTGETIIGANFVKDFFAGIRDIVGGRSKSYERVLRESKETALREMMENAEALGANAIVGIDIDYETVGQNGSMLMVAVSGTAVVI